MDTPNYEDINFLDIVSITNWVKREGESLVTLGGTYNENLLVVDEMREPLKEAVLSFVLQRVVGLWEAASRTTTQVVRRAVSRATVVSARDARHRVQAVQRVVMAVLYKVQADMAVARTALQAEVRAASAEAEARVEELRQEAMRVNGWRAVTAERVYDNARTALVRIEEAAEASPATILLLQTATAVTMVAMILAKAVDDVIPEIDTLEDRLPDFIRTQALADTTTHANFPTRATMRERLRVLEAPQPNSALVARMVAAARAARAARNVAREEVSAVERDRVLATMLESMAENDDDDDFLLYVPPPVRLPGSNVAAVVSETARKKAALAAARAEVATLRAAEMTALYKKYEEVCIANSIPIEPIHEDFICPLSLAIMKYPVHRVNTNFTYERYWIMNWLLDHNTEPLTREIVNASTYVLNVEIKTRIDEFIARITDTINTYKDAAGSRRNKSIKRRIPKQTKRRQPKGKYNKNKYTKRRR
jgi:hypothetical protein